LKLLLWRIDARLGGDHLVTHRNKSQNYFFRLLVNMGVLLIGYGYFARMFILRAL
jgi:hypothetical protein